MPDAIATDYRGERHVVLRIPGLMLSFEAAAELHESLGKALERALDPEPIIFPKRKPLPPPVGRRGRRPTPSNPDSIEDIL